MASSFQSYEEFWPFYVAQHSKASTRAWHFLGTTMVLATVLAAATVSPRWLLAAPLVGYAPAWIGHCFFERNRPATFIHPWWSLRGDFRMYRLMLLGRLGTELVRARTLYPAGA